MGRDILELIITRHGETWGNLPEEDRIKNGRQSDRESMLTEKGIKQAELLGERLEIGEFDCIFASPLIRTIGTAYEVLKRQKNQNLKIEILPDLFEVGTKPGYMGYTAGEIIKMYPKVRVLPCTEEPTPAGGKLALGEENDEIIFERAKRCIKYFRKRFKNGESVLVVAHGTFNNYLIKAALGIENNNQFYFSQENTALSKVRYLKTKKDSDCESKLAYLNDTTHLFKMDYESAFHL
ncbi:MAG TPA: histidine phosphatase family protein [Clostridia bacterium]|nr:histidine phosphatase family protein [Clostridia bacterium]